MTDFCSIVLLHYRRGTRNAVARRCLTALINNTTYPFELIMIDNTQNNRGFSAGRNLGISIATGKYLCIIDDDVFVNPGWLEGCIKALQETDENKYLATPVIQRGILKWELDSVKGYRCNYRTGSNCMVGKREIFERLGKFPSYKDTRGMGYETAKAGMAYASTIARAGYAFLICKDHLAYDLGLGGHSYNEKSV